MLSFRHHHRQLQFITIFEHAKVEWRAPKNKGNFSILFLVPINSWCQNERASGRVLKEKTKAHYSDVLQSSAPASFMRYYVYKRHATLYAQTTLNCKAPNWAHTKALVLYKNIERTYPQAQHPERCGLTGGIHPYSFGSRKPPVHFEGIENRHFFSGWVVLWTACVYGRAMCSATWRGCARCKYVFM